jgi:S1-C subfamily serine protease
MIIRVKHVALFILIFWVVAVFATYGFGQDYPEHPAVTPVTPPPQCVSVLVQDKATSDGPGRSGGSGALIGLRLIVTAHHVVKDRASDRVEILFPSWRLIAGKVVGVDKKRDLAFITLNEDADVSPFTVSDESLWETGDKFSVMGYGYRPFKWQNGTLHKAKYSPSATGNMYYRVISGAEARSGDSGGPVLDEKGRYAGTLWGASRDGATFFSPINEVIKSINENMEMPDDFPKPDDNRPYGPRLYKDETEDQVSGRYHNRSRTRNFFKRSTKTTKTRKVRKVKAVA